MSTKNIVVIGTLDTKGEQILFLKERLEERKCKPIVVDLSMGGKPFFQADITPRTIAQAGGQSIEDILVSKDRYTITQVMQRGAIEEVKKLYSAGKVDGIIAVGGITMGFIGSAVMKVLPFGMPKVIVCPAVMPMYITKLFGSQDIAILQTLVELAGLNDMVKNVLTRAAGAVCGMADVVDTRDGFKLPAKSIAITQDGFSEQCAGRVRQQLEEKGYTVYPFHSQGISDRAMEDLITQGFFDGVVDIVSNGVIDEIFEGNRPGGPERLEAAGKRGIPHVIAPSSINTTGCGPTRKHAEKYASRERIDKIDDLRMATRYNTEELTIAARAYAEKLNKAKGPVKFVFPLRGWSSGDREGSILHAPEEDKVFVEELRRNLRPGIEIEEVDCNLEDPEFADVLVENLIKMFSIKKG